MENQTSRAYVPFGELIVGSHFIFHNQHLINVQQSPVFVKLGHDGYMNTRSGDRYKVFEHNLFRTWVAVLD